MILEKRLNINWQISKQKCWSITNIKKVLVNLLKMYVIVECIIEKKSVVLSVISKP